MKALSCQSPHVCGADASHQQKRLQSFCVDVLVTFWWPPPAPRQRVGVHSLTLPPANTSWMSLQHLPLTSFWFRLGLAVPGKAGSHLDPILVPSPSFLRNRFEDLPQSMKMTLYFKGLSLTALLIINFSENLLCDRYCSKYFTSNWILLLLFYARGNRPVKFVA